MGSKYSGQIFGVRAKEIFLFNQARPKHQIIRTNGNMKELNEMFIKNFDKNLTPVETDLEAFSYDPVI